MNSTLTSKVLVLPSQLFNRVLAFFILGLNTEELGRVTTGLFLGIFKFLLKIINLLLPFLNGFVEGTLFLLQGVGVGVGSLDIDHQIFHLALQSGFGLLQSANLGLRCLCILLGLLKLGHELPPKEENQPAILLEHIHLLLSITLSKLRVI